MQERIDKGGRICGVGMNSLEFSVSSIAYIVAMLLVTLNHHS